jgi:DNA ligase-1
VRDIYTDVEFDIGGGYNAAQRADMWKERHKLPNLVAKYKYFPSGGKDKPRFPVFQGWRDPRDL